MTLYELCGLARHCWRVVLVIMLACLLGSTLVFAQGSVAEYKATATVVATDPSGKVTTAQLMSTVEMLGLTVEREASEGDVVITGAAEKPTGGGQCYILTAVSPDPQTSIDSVNAAAHRIADEARGVYAELQANGEERLHAYADNLELFEQLGNERIDAINSVVAPNTYDFCEFNVEEAQNATQQGSTIGKFLALGLVVGVLMSLCAVALYGFVRRPLKGRHDIEALCSLPILGGRKDSSDVLWANIQFAVDGIPESICLLPADDGDTNALSRYLEQSATASGQRVIVRTLSDGMNGQKTGNGDVGVTVIYACPPPSPTTLARSGALVAQMPRLFA